MAERRWGGALSLLAIVVACSPLPYRRPELVVFAVDGVPPTPENIQTGAYPIWSYEHMYTLGPATGEARSLIDFVLSPAVQGEALVRGGFIPIAAMRVAREHD